MNNAVGSFETSAATQNAVIEEVISYEDASGIMSTSVEHIPNAY